MRSSTDSTSWRLNSFCCIRLIELTCSKKKKPLNLQVHKSPVDDNKNTFLCLDSKMYFSSQWMMTECYLVQLRFLAAVVDWVICAAPVGSLFLLCLHSEKLSDHQGDRPHGNPSHSQIRVSPWGAPPTPLSGGDALITEWLCAGVEGPLQLLGLFVQWW